MAIFNFHFLQPSEEDLLVDDSPGGQDPVLSVQARQLEVQGVEGEGEAETDGLEEESPHPPPATWQHALHLLSLSEDRFVISSSQCNGVSLVSDHITLHITIAPSALL